VFLAYDSLSHPKEGYPVDSLLLLNLLLIPDFKKSYKKKPKKLFYRKQDKKTPLKIKRRSMGIL